jgi:hypothetical protein
MFGGVNKSGGDATNVGVQGADSNAEVLNVAPGGNGILFGRGGNGNADGFATSEIDQYLDQYADGGNGGDDNVQANTNIRIG